MAFASSHGVMAQSSVSLYGVADDSLTYVSNREGHSRYGTAARAPLPEEVSVTRRPTGSIPDTRPRSPKEWARFRWAIRSGKHLSG